MNFEVLTFEIPYQNPPGSHGPKKKKKRMLVIFVKKKKIQKLSKLCTFEISKNPPKPRKQKNTKKTDIS